MASIGTSSFLRGLARAADELHDLIDDDVDLEVRRVDLPRIRCGTHASGVALVTQSQVGCKGVTADLGPLGKPSLRTDLGFGDEVHLHLRVRGDDGADVASFDHDVALAAELTLTLAHHLANFRMPRDDRHEPVDASLADRRCHVRVVDPHAPTLVERDGELFCEYAERRAVAEVERA